MSGKTKQMSQIKQLLRLHQQGSTKKFIARSLQISKNTVKSYLDKLANLQIDIPSLLELEDPVLEAQFHSGSPAYKDERYEQFKQRVDYYIEELSRTGVNKQLLWEEYRKDHPDGYGIHSSAITCRSNKLLPNHPWYFFIKQAKNFLLILLERNFIY